MGLGRLGGSYSLACSEHRADTGHGMARRDPANSSCDESGIIGGESALKSGFAIWASVSECKVRQRERSGCSGSRLSAGTNCS